MMKTRFKCPVILRLLLLLALVAGCGVAMAAPVPQAQESTEQVVVKGQVLDENGEPLIGASVRVIGANVGTATDIDGRYSIKAPRGATLRVSCVGYNTREVRVDGSDLTIIEEPASAIEEPASAYDLSEVVVTALGIKKEAKSLSYNVQ